MKFAIIILLLSCLVFAGKKADLKTVQDTSFAVTAAGDSVRVIKVYKMELDTVLIDMNTFQKQPVLTKQEPVKQEEPAKKKK